MGFIEYIESDCDCESICKKEVKCEKCCQNSKDEGDKSHKNIPNGSIKLHG